MNTLLKQRQPPIRLKQSSTETSLPTAEAFIREYGAPWGYTTLASEVEYTRACNQFGTINCGILAIDSFVLAVNPTPQRVSYSYIYDSGLYTESYFTSCNSLATPSHHPSTRSNTIIRSRLYQSKSQWRLLHDDTDCRAFNCYNGILRRKGMPCSDDVQCEFHSGQTMAGGCGNFWHTGAKPADAFPRRPGSGCNPGTNDCIMDLVPAGQL